MNSIRVMSSVWNYLFRPQTSFHRETSGGVVKCRLFVWPKTPHKQVKVGCLYLELFPSFNCLWGGGGGGGGMAEGRDIYFQKGCTSLRGYPEFTKIYKYYIIVPRAFVQDCSCAIISSGIPWNILGVT